MNRPYLLLLSALVLSGYAVPPTTTQQLQAPDSISPSGAQVSEDAAELLKRVERSMKRYGRDVSEIPLVVESRVSKFDANGKEERSTSSSHSMQFVKRSYGEDVVRRELRLHKPGLHRVSRDETNADSATALLALAFDNGRADSYKYELITHVISNRLEVKFNNSSPCAAFDPSDEQHERRWCGETHLLLDSVTLDPISASFEAGGFPGTFGNIRYHSFKFTEEFQKLSIKGSSVPFLLPARMVVTYESDKGRMVTESKYSVKP